MELSSKATQFDRVYCKIIQTFYNALDNCILYYNDICCYEWKIPLFANFPNGRTTTGTEMLFMAKKARVRFSMSWPANPMLLTSIPRENRSTMANMTAVLKSSWSALRKQPNLMYLFTAGTSLALTFLNSTW